MIFSFCNDSHVYDFFNELIMIKYTANSYIFMFLKQYIQFHIFIIYLFNLECTGCFFLRRICNTYQLLAIEQEKEIVTAQSYTQ